MWSIKIYLLFIFFFNLIRSQRKSGLHLNIVFVATSVVVFIAFCTVLGLYVKGNIQFNMITRNIVMTLNGCIMLVELHFTWNNTEDAPIDCISLLILLLKIIQQIYKSRLFMIVCMNTNQSTEERMGFFCLLLFIKWLVSCIITRILHYICVIRLFLTPRYRQKTYYESYCVIFKDMINAIKIYDV